MEALPRRRPHDLRRAGEAVICVALSIVPYLRRADEEDLRHDATPEV
jgi:hypothetical protein